MPATGAAVAVAVAFLLVEDQTVQAGVFVVAAVHLLVSPQILKRAAREG